MRELYRHGHEIYLKNTTDSVVECMIIDQRGKSRNTARVAANKEVSIFYQDAVVNDETITIRISGSKGNAIRTVVLDSRQTLPSRALWHKHRLSY